jgi:hypothetical protein
MRMIAISPEPAKSIVKIRRFSGRFQMLRKALVPIILIMICLLCPAGCKKSSPESGSAEETVKTAAEYAEDARREINEDNMAVELEKIEEALTQEENEQP